MDEAGAEFRLCLAVGGAVEAAPENMDYCLSVLVTSLVAAGASVSLDSPGFSEVAGSTGLSGALGMAAFRGGNQWKISRSPHAKKAATKW